MFPCEGLYVKRNKTLEGGWGVGVGAQPERKEAIYVLAGF